MSESELSTPTNFIRNIIKEDLDSGKHTKIISRFPPEPNGYLHIGHAKSICLNFGVAQDYDGVCNLRFDDTNPEKENQLYINAIKKDVAWLGFEWNELRHASDYFEKLFNIAIKLVEKGLAYVDSMSADDIREYRGTLTQPGKNSLYRERPIEENLSLLKQMRAGEFKDGEHVLRAKIDMSSPNMNLRDPIIYRIRHIHHHQTGNEWCVYPMYDFTHALSDAFEGITHSLCTLEFEDHRPLYDWVIEHADTESKPRQIEFGRLFLEYAITSKRKLNQLVDEQHVDGWDDPRMPTISGLRRRGYTPSSIREFCKLIGVSKSEGTIDMGVLENCIREDLNTNAPRAMAVLDPIKVVLTNYPDGHTETLSASNHPQNESMGKREIFFSKELYIERDDFMEDAPNKFFRLKPDGEVRLRNAYVIKCENVIKNESGDVVELHCSYDADTLGKKPEGRKVKGVIHWVSAPHAIDAEVRLYDRLFNTENPGASDDFIQHLNPDSLSIKPACKLEASLANTIAPAYQFERLGYFCIDETFSTAEKKVFNRTVTLRDSWSKSK